MKRLGLLIVLAATITPTAQAYDREPQLLYGTAHDSWGLTVTGGESDIQRRYPGVLFVKCVGGMIVGSESESSWVGGLTRYWDKLICAGYTTTRHAFALIADAKGPHSWIIYRLRGVTIDALRYR